MYEAWYVNKQLLDVWSIICKQTITGCMKHICKQTITGCMKHNM